MGYDSNNVFAKILRGELPAQKVYEDAETLAFMDIMPRCDGHTLVIPKTPARNMLDANPAQLAACMKAVQKVATAAMKAFGAAGITRAAVQRAGRRAGRLSPALPHSAAAGGGVARPALEPDGETRGARGQRRQDPQGDGDLTHGARGPELAPVTPATPAQSARSASFGHLQPNASHCAAGLGECA